MDNEMLMSYMRTNFDVLGMGLFNTQIMILSIELLHQWEKENPDEEYIKRLESDIRKLQEAIDAIKKEHHFNE